MAPNIFVNEYIERYYDAQAEREWQRAERHRTEFAVTLRALARYLPPPPAAVLDCGGGPGRYAIELARQGYEVTLFDLSGENLALARAQAREAGVTLAALEQGNALDLSRFAGDAFDAVLLMGPLYHLLDPAERRQALAEAQRVLKPGGPLFAAFISRYATLRWAAAYDPDLPARDPETAACLFETGVLRPGGPEAATFCAHFAHPTEVAPLLWHAGLELRAVLGVEGLVSMIEAGVNALEGEAWQAWVDLNERAAADASIHGCVEHLLAIAAKPRWRPVLRHIARVLNDAGVPFLAEAGVSIALQGVPVPVKDLDLGTTAEDAYRFQALFPDHVVEPVAFRENERYRSHFGRFQFDGVKVEVIGGSYRKQGGVWVPASHEHTTSMDLDGIPLRVPWLEEEALTYLWRGRLDRAALCLAYCNPERIAGLMGAP